MSHGSEPVFFLDRNLGRNIVSSALREAGFAVETADAHFPPDTPDDVWLRLIFDSAVPFSESRILSHNDLRAEDAVFCRNVVPPDDGATLDS